MSDDIYIDLRSRMIMPTTNTDGSVLVRHGDAELKLLPDKAIYFPACDTLIIADVHVGKGTAFRHAGLPVPVGSSQKDLKRIDALLSRTGAKRLVILGDFIHAATSRDAETLETIRAWRAGNAATRVMLVRGNHDQFSGRTPAEWNIEEIEEPFDEGGGVLFAHQPRTAEGPPVLCGHVHPVVSIRDFDGSTVRVPCFWFDDTRRCAVLPSFGSLTGGYNVGHSDGKRVYLALSNRVIVADKVSAKLSLA